MFFFKQKTSYEMRISDWSSDVCSSDLGFVAAPQVGGVDGEVGDLPLVVVLALARGEALLDRVLMAAREGGIDQLAAIGVARVDRELVAIFDRGDDLVDVREVELWVDALRVHVERDGDEAGVAGALADRKSTRLNSSH